MKRGLFFILFFSSFVSSAQQLPDVVNFKTPEAAAFDKYIETPVSYYTGVPNISIPLYSVSIKGVTVPITLDYHAGGIRVDEEATWVGLGWSLNYGGQISRKVRGQPDEQSYFRTNENDYQHNTIAFFMQLPDLDVDQFVADRNTKMYACKQQLSGSADYMPDEFYYSILGYSGRFMFNQGNRKFVFYPKEDMAINYDVSNINSAGFPTANYHVQDWNMTLPNGTEVAFGQDGFSEQKDNTQLFYQRGAWMVKSINNTSNESIDYTYQPFNYTSTRLSGEVFSAATRKTTTTIATQQYNDAFIKEIDFPGGYIIFTTQPRDDMPTQSLREIDVYNDNGVLLKRVSFLYSYFSGRFGSSTALAYLNSNYTDKRLRLDKLIIWNNAVQPQVYSFDYYASDDQGYVLNQPSKTSYAQDYWGYFNGALNNTLVPYLSPTWQGSGGGDRNVHSEYYGNVFALKTITYPTGGKAEYIYEGNTANASGAGAAFLSSIVYPGKAGASAYIDAQGPDRLTFMEGSPDFTDASGNSTFTKAFTIGSNADVSNGFVPVTVYYSTNFGNTVIDNEEQMNCPQNVEFKLEKIASDGSKTQVMNVYGRDCLNGHGTFTLTSSSGSFNLPIGNYLLTLVISYPYSQIHSGYPDNYKQAHHTYFTAQWPVINPVTPPPPTTQNYLSIGGFRIKNINLYDANGALAIKKQYTYLAPDGGSSGNVISWPKQFQFYFQEIVDPNIGHQDHADLRFYGNSVTPLETTSGSYVGYQYVTEQTVGLAASDNLTTKYNFSFVPPYYDQNYSITPEGTLDAQEWKQGKLLSTQYFKNDKAVKQELYQYYQFSPHLTLSTDEDYVDEINQDYISYQVIKYGTTDQEGFYDPLIPGFGDQVLVGQVGGTAGTVDGAIHYFYGVSQISDHPGVPIKFPYFKRYTGFDKLQSKKTISFDDAGNQLSETETNFYEKTPLLNQLTKTQSVTSKGDILTKSLQYPIDFSSTAPYNSMIQRNMVNPVIVQTATKNSTFLQSSKTNFQDWGNNIIAPVTTESKVSTYPSEMRSQYYGYDNLGNPLSVSKANDVLETYLWGYNSLYPVAKIIGANYNTAISFVNQSTLQYPASDQQLRDELNKVRTGLAGEKALVYTYTYTPLVGITSQTDAANRTTYYEYDGLNRLSLIRDQDHNIIKKLDYHNQGTEGVQIFYNTEASMTYSRTNCDPGSLGGPYTTTVPANTYTSIISQDDADMQATYYLNLHAPVNANTYGSCTVVPGAISLGYYCPRGIPFYFKFTNVTTNVIYTFQTSGQSGTMGLIPEGNYNLEVTCPTLNSSSFSYSISGYTQSGVTVGALYNIHIGNDPNIQID